MLNANAPGEAITAKLDARAYLEALKDEAIDAKAEWIERRLREGVEVEGLCLDSIIDTVLDSDDIRESLKIAYLYGNVQAINILIDHEITRLANAIAPELVQARLDSLEDV